MEPIRLWRRNLLRGHEPALVEDEPKHPVYFTEYAALPRADFDALVKRDSTCPLCGDDLDPDEADYDSDIPPAGAGVCSRCFCRWHDAPVYEKRAKEATARADKAEKDRDDARALLREARGNVATSPFHKDLLARIDDALNRKGGDGDAIKAFKAVKCFKAGGVMVHVDPDAPPGSMNVVPPGYICPQCGRDDEGIWRGT